MEYEIRWVLGHEIPQALDLAWRMFAKYDAPDYGEEHTERMRVAIEDRLKDLSIYGERLMVVAIVDDRVVGMLETYGTNRISLLFVDSEYQRKGIATALMNKIAEELKCRGYDKIVLNASPYGLTFYKNYGFDVLEEEWNADTPWKTPMWYPLSM